jgi:UDP-N-acetylmuramate--alanine ligase
MSLAWEHSAAHVDLPPFERPERLAVTKALTSVNPDHPELAAARRLLIPAEAWQQVIADTAATTGQRLVAVAGTHGKSTTTGWLVDLLVRDGRDPSAFVGALMPRALTGGSPATARIGAGDVFLVEADEYAGNFDPYRPSVIALLNAEWDHPDVFADEAAVIDAFEDWIRRSGNATLVVNVADRGAAVIVERLHNWPGIVVRVGSEPLTHRIGLPGPANAANAAIVAGVAQVLGVSDRALKQSLAKFKGVGRRLELKGEVGGVTVLDDYGHHPTAILRTLEAVRERYPDRRVWAVYEPLTFHRTAAMLTQFADALGRANEVVIADIWAGRDPDTTLTSATALADEVTRRGGPRAAAPGSVEQTADYLATRVKPDDVVLVMGGGRSYVIADRLVALLAATPAGRSGL